MSRTSCARPLTTVRMAADVLHDGREDFPPHLARATELMVDELDRFESLLADLLEISRYDAGMAELSAETIDIRSSIHASIAAAAPLAEQFGIQIVTIAARTRRWSPRSTPAGWTGSCAT